MSEFKYKKSEYRRPAASLQSVELFLDIYTDRIEGRETLVFRAAEPLDALELDAQDLDVAAVALIGGGGGADKTKIPLTSTLIKSENKLAIFLPRRMRKGEKFAVEINAVSRPTENILDGVYFDVTPAGNHSPQLISQCQQWGFQRIMPIVDDCTAKPVWRTTLEADARYTHLITNGDVDRKANPDGVPVPAPASSGDGDGSGRVRITYVNNIPMPPYLFVVTAGTFDELSDSVALPNGRRVELKYLVPPGCADGARVPMDILKESVLWQARRVGYEYKRDCYRTICMEKSNFGGMENAGNTTIITEAALIDEWTSDRRLLYAHGVIIHEFEHDHCGGSVTMETPFDMWLNEAFTVNIEREFVAAKFGASLCRLDDLDAMRSPLRGPLAAEDGGDPGRIVREGFDNPDDVVDGVTYVKAPEVLEMLRALLGHDKYESAIKRYFKKHAGGNASTEQFLAAFQQAAKMDLEPFFKGWLYEGGYPLVSCLHEYCAATRRLSVALSQQRRGAGAGAFVMPFRFTAHAADGREIPNASARVVFDKASAVFVLENVAEAPAFMDWNSGEAFYGAIEDFSSGETALFLSARMSPNLIGRVEAKRRLDDMAMRSEISKDTRIPGPSSSAHFIADWLALHADILADETLPSGIKARMLTISEEMLDRAILPLAAERCKAAGALRKQVAGRVGEGALLSAFAQTMRPAAAPAENIPDAVNRRALNAALAMLLASLGAPAAVAALKKLFKNADCVQDRLNAAKAALNSGDASVAAAMMRKLGARCEPHPGAYGAYLQILGANPANDVFEQVAKEETNKRFKLAHPGHSRALYGALAANNAVIWTPRGLAWAEATLLKLAPVNENTALVVASAFQQVRNMRAPLRDNVEAMLLRVASASPANAASLRAKIARIIGCEHKASASRKL